MKEKEQLALSLVARLRQSGFEAYFAGGCVRDRLRGVAPKDFDIATSATPPQVQNLFEKTIPVGAHFGVILVVEDGIPFEVATFRRDGGYQDGRHPSHVEFTHVKEDALRRDFTVNGLYWDPEKKVVLDFVEGQKDIQNKIIRTIGPAKQRFEEDHLRMIRAIRFSVQLGFAIEPEAFETIKSLASLINKVSPERIREEFTKILTSPRPAYGIRLLDQCGLLKQFLPEMELMKGVEQPSQYHPEGDVFIHTLMLMDQLSQAPMELAWGALLHDVAKPQTFVRAPDRIRFHGHDKIGAEMATEICKRFAISNEKTEIIASLVNEHLRFKDAFSMRVATLKRFLSLPHFDWHLELHRIDCLASHGNLEAHKFCSEKYEEWKKLPPPPSRIIGGKELIALGLKPSPYFTELLREVEDGVLEGTLKTKEEALDYVKKKIASLPK